MRHNPRRWLWLLLLLPATVPAASWGLDQLMRDLAAGGAAVVHYTEEKQLAALDIPLTTHGELRFVPPDFLERTVAGPAAERYQVRGNELLIETPEGSHAVRLGDYPPLQAFIESFRASLTGDLDTLRRFYRPDLEGSEAHWRLTLIPRLAEMAAHVKQVVITGDHGSIHRIETVARDGDTTVMRLGTSGD